jgi:hypothetical protein
MVPSRRNNIVAARRLEDDGGPIFRHSVETLASRGERFDCTAEYSGEYWNSAKGAFQNLRLVASQLAGLLLFRTIGGSGWGCHTMLLRASEAHLATRDAVLSLVPPPPARRGHRHLLEAQRCLTKALALANSYLEPTDSDELKVDHLVGAAIEHLRRAGRATPGFEIVAFSQSCCGFTR